MGHSVSLENAGTKTFDTRPCKYQNFSTYFKAIEENPDREFMMAMNYIEIYNEQIRDLLSDSTKKAYITEDESGEVQITNITQVSLLFIQYF